MIVNLDMWRMSSLY